MLTQSLSIALLGSVVVPGLCGDVRQRLPLHETETPERSDEDGSKSYVTNERRGTWGNDAGQGNDNIQLNIWSWSRDWSSSTSSTTSTTANAIPTGDSNGASVGDSIGIPDWATDDPSDEVGDAQDEPEQGDGSSSVSLTTTYSRPLHGQINIWTWTQTDSIQTEAPQTVAQFQPPTTPILGNNGGIGNFNGANGGNGGNENGGGDSSSTTQPPQASPTSSNYVPESETLAFQKAPITAAFSTTAAPSQTSSADATTGTPSSADDGRGDGASTSEEHQSSDHQTGSNSVTETRSTVSTGFHANSSITRTATSTVGGFNASAPYFDFTKYGSNTTAYNEYLSLHRDNQQCERSSESWISRYYTETVWQTVNTDPFSGESYFSTLFPENSASLLVKGNSQTANPYYCCCCCSIYWPDVSVAYWPSPQANTQCLAQLGSNQGAFQDAMTAYFNTEDIRTAANTEDILTKPQYPRDVGFKKRDAAPWERGQRLKGRSFHALSAPPMLARDPNAPVTTVGPDGFTYTSPYVYLEIPEMQAADGCGYVGQKYTSVRWSYQPELISSIWVDDPSCWVAPWADNRDEFSRCNWQTKQFNFNDLPCPPESLRAAGHYEYIFDPSVPYAPLLAPPPDLQWLDPAWGSCTPTFGWDPYIALTPEANLEAATTATYTRESTSARPGLTAASVPGPTHTQAVHNPAQPSNPAQQPLVQVAQSSSAAASASPGAAQTASGAAPTGGAESTKAASGFAPVTTDGYTISFASDGNPVVAGKTLQPGETVTVDGQTYAAPSVSAAASSGSSHNAPVVIIGTSTYHLAPVLEATTAKAASSSPALTFQPAVATEGPLWVAVAGQVLTYTLNGVVVDGTTVLPGSAYTIGNTLYSIPEPTQTPAPKGPPASIVIGSSTYPLPAPPITAPPTAVEIDGATLTEGRAAVLSELGGGLETVSLGTNGELILGTATINVVATPEAHLGDIIWSALGGGGSASEGAEDAQATIATGGAARRRTSGVMAAAAMAGGWLLI